MKTRIFKKLPDGSSYRVIQSPVGPLYLIAGPHALRAVLWECDLEKPETKAAVAALPVATEHAVIDEAAKQLKEYFTGKRKSFDLPLEMHGTDFQRAAWQALLTVPYGETASYEAQAIKLGGREKVRAVGTANGMNPISIIVPCHRVVGKDGSLTGFGGGLEAKRWLLDLEAGVAQLPFR
ncbi:methylated-DNA--[protein]-cysteine S-methyltransferase [Kordiimonas sp.]|uniref:methylated-DNA--[protein]-cysteine S-methyltransferase n=1 Tax=Kordiimonas sp. TaxID=1970157 RepID=UPI003A8E8956